MYKAINKTVIFFFIFLQFSSLHSSNASNADKTLETDHFIIKTELDNSSFALFIAEKIEYYHRVISFFLEYEPVEKMTVTVVTDKNFLTVLSGSTGSVNNLTVSVDDHYSDPDTMVYRKLFMAYLEKSMNNKNPASVLDEEFYNSILNYSISDKKFVQAVVYDLVNHMELLPVNLRGIDKYSSSQQEVIYTAFIDYIISVFGKKIFFQSVKDAHYYNDIITSVSMITGINVLELNAGFNGYLSGYKTDLKDKRLKKKVPEILLDGFNNISFSILTDYFAVLQNNKKDYRILLQSDKNSWIIPLKHSENGSIFNNIIYISDNLIGVSEITRSDSFIHIYNTATDTCTRSYKLPYLYLSSFSVNDKDYLLFSASCGIYSDVYNINLQTGYLQNITMSRNLFCPVKIKGKVYCISVSDKYSIIEKDEETGREKLLFSTSQKISELNSMGENYLIFVMEINGIKNIYRLNLNGENLVQVTDDNFFNHSPHFSNENIYYFSYYRHMYRIFFTAYDELK